MTAEVAAAPADTRQARVMESDPPSPGGARTGRLVRREDRAAHPRRAAGSQQHGAAAEGLTAVTDRDAVAYPAHVLAALALEATRADPAAIGLQWLKAAAHARSDARLSRSIRGLRAAHRLSRHPDAFVATMARRGRSHVASQHRRLRWAVASLSEQPSTPADSQGR